MPQAAEGVFMEVSISMPGDLHNHSTCSDGSVPIHRLPLMAARAGLDTMAISDHDTLLSVNYCYEHPVQDGVHLLPAAELTGYDHEHRHRVHLLCYYPDPENRELREHCDILRQRRNECGLQSAKEIEALYPQFRTEQALEYAKDSGVLFKSSIMEALHQLGLCDAVYGRLYSYLFGWEPRGVVLHQVKYPSVQEVLATAKAAGAVVVFAHPTVYKSMPLVRQLAKEGMTMLVVTHEMGFARNVSNKVVFMENGVVVEEGPSKEFFANPREERTRTFLQNIEQHYE